MAKQARASRIENYLGFPFGISGQDLTVRAYIQAQQFGAEILIAKGTRLVCEYKPYLVEVENGTRIPARAVVIATGAEYRRPPLKNLSRFEGLGIYYGITFVEAQFCDRRRSNCGWRGNSAGQAAVFLAQRTKRCICSLGLLVWPRVCHDI